MIPARDEWIALAALYLMVSIIDLLNVDSVHAERDDAKDVQFALNLPIFPTFWEWSVNRHDPS